MNKMNRRSFLAGVSAASLSLAGREAFASTEPAQIMFAGTFIGKGSKGIYAYRWRAESGTLQPLGLAVETASPSFLTLSPDRRRLYSVNEIDTYKGTASGSVSAFHTSLPAIKLTLQNVVSSGGAGPCNITIDHTGKAVFVADYAGGSLSSYRVLADGGLSAPVSNFHFHGHSVTPRQTTAHTHCVTVAPGNRYLLVNDLGMDRIMVYRFNPRTAALIANAPAYYSAIPGSGPRNLAFHPNHRWAYSVNEVGNTVDVLDWNGERGTLTRTQNLSTLPSGFRGTNTAATVAIEKSGRFAYVSNRGVNDVVVFSINQTNGALHPIQRISCGGKTPRFITLDPSERWLLSANQDSANIVLLSRSAETGRLRSTDKQVALDSPVCLVFA